MIDNRNRWHHNPYVYFNYLTAQINDMDQIPETRSSFVSPEYISGRMNFIFRARMLWRDLSTWLSVYMVSLLSNVGNTEAINKRLYSVPSEYESILSSFFGNQVTEQLANQLVQYIAIFQSLLAAMMSNDVDSINNYTRQIYQVVDAIAELLSGINPYWNKNEWVALLTSFTSMNIQQATTLLSGRFESNIDIFDRALSLSNILGDYFSEGLTYYFMQDAPLQTP